MAPILQTPDQIVHSVFDINFNALWDGGVRGVALDVDNTLGRMGCTTLDKETIEFLTRVRRRGFSLCLASNDTRDMWSMMASLGARSVQPRAGVPKKPHPGFFREIHKTLGFHNPAQIVMIGDKFLHDVVPAKAFGMRGVLVNPIGRDLLLEYVAMRRQRERRAMRSIGLRRARRP